MIYEYKGQQYTSKKKLLESEGLKYLPAMKSMSRYNIDVLTYLQYVEEGRIIPNSFEFDGVMYSSLKECVETLLPEISLSQVYYKRRQHRLTAKECLEKFLNGDFDNTFEIKGIKFKSVEECANHFGYTYDELYSAYQNKKMDISIYEFLEKYFNGEIEHKLTRITYRGVEYKSITRLLDEKNFNKSKFYETKRRRNYENSLDLVADVEDGKVDIKEVTVRTKYGFEFDGKSYKSQNQFFEQAKKENPKRFSQHDYFKLKKENVVADIEEYLDYRTKNPM